ncbi:16S rRNA G527 N7-methylase RsmG [Butyricimonas paravirosa]|uniref:16S rRNA G527 N7-methylase RsmG n=1 Tax=Butyricimonas paravirosa TaxID=1472417 RepID=A0A7X5YJA9_9BACT|nr:hypothetical protein [Butyricimonas paravirosa]NJC20911.1 16S rRNA G527 N7-methylase RsmG [Butyricimonas paravirosa]
MDIVEKYFTGLSERQLEQFQQLEGLYREWNEKINVISRKDIDLKSATIIQYTIKGRFMSR